jgi:hypothetical protein
MNGKIPASFLSRFELLHLLDVMDGDQHDGWINSIAVLLAPRDGRASEMIVAVLLWFWARRAFDFVSGEHFVVALSFEHGPYLLRRLIYL